MSASRQTDRNESPIRIGCAGWTLPTGSGDAAHGSHLERYGRLFSAVEINSSFYRSHQKKTYVRWAESVGDDFRFSVKMPRAITHERRLESVDEPLSRFLDEVAGLGKKLGCLLVQTPPSLDLRTSAGDFFQCLRSRTDTDVVCEPRHRDWFGTTADELLESFGIARVIADPPCDPREPRDGSSLGVTYLRLHGAPKIYYSNYDDAALDFWRALLERRRKLGHRCWCIFDNTAAGHAVANAAALRRRLDAAFSATAI